MTPPTLPPGVQYLSFPEPRGIYVTYRCNDGHATRVRDDVDADCDLCLLLNPSAPPDEYPCKHCSVSLEQHADSSCLFMPTKFEPMDQYQLQRESDEMWEAMTLPGRQHW